MRRNRDARLTGYELSHLDSVLEAQRLAPPEPGHIDEPGPATVPGRARAVTGAGRAVRRRSAGAARLGVLARQAGQLAADGAAPRTSLKVPVSGHHRLLLVRADLERARAVAHAHGGTVNDVVLAAVAGGARSVVAARGELTPRLVLRAAVAASVRAAPDPRATGHQVGILSASSSSRSRSQRLTPPGGWRRSPQPPRPASHP